MSKIIRTVWDIEPHTAKKHEILRRYFQAWLPILGRYNSRLLYIDAFAGPGEYSKGEDGSPLVILKAARDHVLRPSCELVCLFIESDDDRYARSPLCRAISSFDQSSASSMANSERFLRNWMSRRSVEAPRWHLSTRLDFPKRLSQRLLGSWGIRSLKF